MFSFFFLSAFGCETAHAQAQKRHTRTLAPSSYTHTAIVTHAHKQTKASHIYIEKYAREYVSEKGTGTHNKRREGKSVSSSSSSSSSSCVHHFYSMEEMHTSHPKKTHNCFSSNLTPFLPLFPVPLAHVIVVCAATTAAAAAFCLIVLVLSPSLSRSLSLALSHTFSLHHFSSSLIACNGCSF